MDYPYKKDYNTSFFSIQAQFLSIEYIIQTPICIMIQGLAFIHFDLKNKSLSMVNIVDIFQMIMMTQH